MMDLLDNYLAAVGRNLPSKDRSDIIAELRDVLLAKAEEQEERDGQVDWTGLLRDFGHPVVVAARYRKQQWLIGPELYPFYVHFLKIIVGIVLTVITVIGVVKAVVWTGQPGPIIVDYLRSLWFAAASTVGWVTIGFVVAERFGGASAKHCRHWKPTELPDVLDCQPSVYHSAFQIGFGVLMLLWWLGLVPTPWLDNGQFRLVAAPIWASLFWPVAALLAARFVYNLIIWLRPRWKNLRNLLGVTSTAGAFIIAAIIYRAGRWVEVLPTGMPADQAVGLQTSLDLAFRITAVVLIVIWTLGALGWLYKFARDKAEQTAVA
jgi:hypothetical protein